MKKQVILYGISLGLLVALLRYSEYAFLIRDHAVEVYGGVLAVIFTVLGVWLGLKLTGPRKEIVKELVIVEKKVYEPAPAFAADAEAIKALGISQREREVLELIAQGMSNQEIADRLFVSLNTIKTHSSRLFEKLDVSRRTQAVQKAKELRLIA